MKWWARDQLLEIISKQGEGAVAQVHSEIRSGDHIIEELY
jgi:hypothetical protein